MRNEGERSLASRIAGRARRISRHFAKCLEVMGDGRRATTFCRMSAGEGSADRAETEMVSAVRVAVDPFDQRPEFIKSGLMDLDVVRMLCKM